MAIFRRLKSPIESAKDERIRRPDILDVSVDKEKPNYFFV